jgi:hypothetical protein
MPSVDRILAAVRYRLSPRSAYVDLHGSSDQTILIAGSRRSGTTWVSELVNYRNEFRTIFEPFHPTHSSWTGATNSEWAKYVEPQFEDRTLEERCIRLWAGRLRDAWTDKHNTKRIATQRIIKSVESTNLLPWICARWPDLKIVYVVRHPFATAESQLEVSFRDDGLTDLAALRSRTRLVGGVYATLADATAARELVQRSSDPFEQHVVRWCLENRIPLSALDPRNVHVVLYEDLVLQTRAELARLGWFLERPFDSAALVAARKPSRTDFRSRARRSRDHPSLAFLSEWREKVGEEKRDAGLEVLRAFELDHLYNGSPLPLVQGSNVLTATHPDPQTEPQRDVRDSRTDRRDVGGVS